MNPLIANATGTLLETLLAVGAFFVQSKNPAYAPAITPILQALNAEIASIFAGNAPTPHAVTPPPAAPAATATAPSA